MDIYCDSAAFCLLAVSGSRERSITRSAVGDDARARRLLGTGYNWRKGEVKLNALPQFVTQIDGFDIQFVYIARPILILCRSS